VVVLKTIARFVSLVSLMSVAAFPLGCSLEGERPDDDADSGGSDAGQAGSGDGAAANAGGSANGGSAGQVMDAGSGGVGAGSGGTRAGIGGADPSGGSGGSVGGRASGGTGGVTAGAAGTGTGGVTAGTAGAAGDASSGGTGGAGPSNPLAHLADSAREIGLLLANRFAQQALAFDSVADLPGDGYKTACEWYGALAVAKLTNNPPLLDTLVTKFEPLRNDFVSAMTGGEAHVDRYIFGMVPLEIYLQTDDASYLPLGTEVADVQQTTSQTRDAIDDMFMMTILQVQAYRATRDQKYLSFMSQTMVDYLSAQQENGLFFHNVTDARVHWGRGNGWFAAGMAEMMRELPTDAADYVAIEAGYKAMMAGLLEYQADSGLWYQVIDQPNNASNWLESSGSAMFTYAMIAGVRRGVLDAATYVPAIEKAWAGLEAKIDAQGDVSDICIGTWYKASAQEYMGLDRLTGDGHGQAPVLWAAAELLR